MKSKSLLSIASLAVALAIPVNAQTQAANDSHSRYRVILLSGLGGASSSGNTINNRGWVMGNSDLAGDAITHATLWRHGRPNDLGTLGGPSSSIAWPVKNDKGVISGISEMADLDTYGENWSCWVFFPAPLPSSFPVPGSPQNEDSRIGGCNLSTFLSNWLMGFEEPTISSNIEERSISSRSTRFSFRSPSSVFFWSLMSVAVAYQRMILPDSSLMITWQRSSSTAASF